MTDPLIVACARCGGQSQVTALAAVRGVRRYTASCRLCANALDDTYATYDEAREAWRKRNDTLTKVKP